MCGSLGPSIRTVSADAVHMTSTTKMSSTTEAGVRVGQREHPPGYQFRLTVKLFAAPDFITFPNRSW